MQEQLKMMEEFHQAFGHPIGERNLFAVEDRASIEKAWKFHNLRVSLHAEECKELNDELWLAYVSEKISPNLLKEGADLLYVLLGTFVSLGLGDQLIEAYRRVHLSNMSKLGEDGKPIYREDGKVLKGPNYQPPNLDDLVGEPK